MSKSQNNTVTASYNFVSIFQSLEAKKPPAKHPNELPDQLKVAEFISEFLANGWSGKLKGKNIPSDNVPTDDPQWLEKVSYARKHNLAHYHIGIPYYCKSENGYYTSEYIIHYQVVSDSHIKLIDLDCHPPFELPKESYMDGMVSL